MHEVTVVVKSTGGATTCSAVAGHAGSTEQGRVAFPSAAVLAGQVVIGGRAQAALASLARTGVQALVAFPPSAVLAGQVSFFEQAQLALAPEDANMADRHATAEAAQILKLLADIWYSVIPAQWRTSAVYVGALIVISWSVTLWATHPDIADLLEKSVAIYLAYLQLAAKLRRR